MSTYNGDVPWERGTQDTRDTGQRIARLPVGTPDWTQFPWHPPGTWERAMAYLAAGYRPTDQDMGALHAWNSLGTEQQREYLKRAREFRLAVLDAAAPYLVNSPPVPLDSLVTALATDTQLGTPAELATVLRSLLTLDPSQPGDMKMDSAQVKHLYLGQRYSVQGHYFSRSRKALLAFAQEHYLGDNDQDYNDNHNDRN